MEQKNIFIGVTLALVMALLLVTVALADTIKTDGDTLASSLNPSVNDCTVAHTFSGQSRIDFAGGQHFASGAELSITITYDDGITATGPSSTTLPNPWDSGGFHIFDGISTTVPAGTANGTYKVYVTASGAKSTSGTYTVSDFFNVNVNCPITENTPPVVEAGGTYTGGEGSDIALSGGSASDSDGTISSTIWTIISKSVGSGDCTLSNATSLTGATIKCTDNGSAVVRLTATDDDNASAYDEAGVTINNANPVVAQPVWSSTSVACRVPVTLTGISFSDAGVIDYPWNVNINWNDGPSTNYNTNDQGSQTSQTHTYNTPGSYSAVVTVTDKDSGVGSASSTSSLTVLQTYTIDFRPPFDDSTPSGLIVNTMKNGRVVPVKVTIYDDCKQEYVTDPSTLVTIKVTKTSGTTGSSDPVETYADAGQSSAGTNLFRWTSDPSVTGGGFWIYNLDSKALGLVVNNLYRVDVYVGSNLATGSTWAVLQPVK